MIAGNKPRRAGAHAILQGRGRGGAFQRRMVGEVQIIVARKRQESAALTENPKAILAQALGKRAPQGGALEFRQFESSEVIQGPHQHLTFVGVALAPTPWSAIEPRFAIGLGCAIKYARQ